MTTILYNGQNAFSDCIGTPLVSMSSNFAYVNSQLSRIKTFNLRGKIKGDSCSDNFSSLYNKQQSIIEKFRKNFSSFSIQENSNIIFSHNYAIVKSISFDENSYFNVITFTVVIECHDYNYANNGILDPSDQVNVQKNEDGTESISRTISCRAINTSDQAIDNAKAFIYTRMAASPAYPILGPLTLQSEKVNRLTGECSISLNYIYDTSNKQGISNVGVITYSVEISQSEGRVEVSVNGSIAGGISSTPTSLRQCFDNINWYNICLSEYANEFEGDLSDAPIQFSVTEDLSNNSLSFNISYDNLSNKEACIIDTTTIATDYQNGSKCISLRLDFVSDYGCRLQRWSKVQSLYNTTDVYAIVVEKWELYGNDSISTSPKSKSVSYDENNARISTAVTYCNDNVEDCGCLEGFSYTMNFVPPITKYSASQTLDGEGCYYTQDLGFKNRFRFGINGRFIPSRCCSREESERQLHSRINFLVSEFFPASDRIVESANISYDLLGITNFSFELNGLLDLDVPEWLLNDSIINPGDEFNLLVESGYNLLTEDGGVFLLE